MKKVISDGELLDKIEEAICLLCDTVGETLGPKGRNVIVNTSLEVPFVTNDGVTIAKNIESEDEVINCILTIAKEASLKTDEIVGDGTTSTLVLLKTIVLRGIQAIKNGTNRITLTKELKIALEEVLNYLEKLKMKTELQDYKKIAINCANDKELGNLTYQAFKKIRNRKGIKIAESTHSESYVEFLNGYPLDSGIVSPYLLGKDKTYHFNNAYVLLCDIDIVDIEDLANIINLVIEEKKDLVILANSYSDDVINKVSEINERMENKICLVINVDYAVRKKDILEDLACLIDSWVVNDIKYLNSSFLKIVDSVKGDCEKTIISMVKVDKGKIKKRLSEIKKEMDMTNEDYQLEYLEERMAKLNETLATIYVGGHTKTEIKEKIMRVNDSLNSLALARNGVLLGEGVTYLKIRENIKENNLGMKIMRETLLKPFEQIMKNLGIDEKEKYQLIKNNNFEVVYNEENNVIENRMETSILDTYEVVKKTLQTATSIAIMLLTCSSLIVNENIEQTSSLTL